MKLTAVVALASGFVAAPLIAAGSASALPPAWCDGAECVPGVVKNAVPGERCVGATRYAFGLGSSGTTLICSALNNWVETKPLIGVRPQGAPCDANEKGSAQSPDGIPMGCNGHGWVGDYDDIFYTKGELDEEAY